MHQIAVMIESGGFGAADLSMDQARIVKDTTRLLQATVDVIASNGWLSPALTAMELSQMVTQGLWDRDPVLLQLPHFNRDLCKKARQFQRHNNQTLIRRMQYASH